MLLYGHSRGALLKMLAQEQYGNGLSRAYCGHDITLKNISDYFVNENIEEH